MWHVSGKVKRTIYIEFGCEAAVGVIDEVLSGTFVSVLEEFVESIFSSLAVAELLVFIVYQQDGHTDLAYVWNLRPVVVGY